MTMRYRLRTLLILLAVLPPVLAASYGLARRELHRRAVEKRLADAADIGLQEVFHVLHELSDRGELR